MIDQIAQFELSSAQVNYYSEQLFTTQAIGDFYDREDALAYAARMVGHHLRTIPGDY